MYVGVYVSVAGEQAFCELGCSVAEWYRTVPIVVAYNTRTVPLQPRKGARRLSKKSLVHLVGNDSFYVDISS